MRNIISILACLLAFSADAALLQLGTNLPSNVQVGTNLVQYVNVGTNRAWSRSSDVLTGLIAWWKMDGNANDSIGVNNGTIVNATNATGKVNGCYGFNGTSAKINFGTVSFTNVSVCLWLNVDGGGVVEQYFLHLGSGAGDYSPLIYLTKSEGGYLLRVFSGAQITSAAPLPFNSWQHIEFTYDGTTATLFTNGIQLDQTTSMTIPTGARDVIFGKIRYYDLNWYSGLLDEVRIYNRALSSNEVLQVYNATK